MMMKISWNIFEHCLTKQAFDAISAPDALSALRILDTRKVHAVVSDIRMPKMDGRTFRGALRKNERLANLPVILMSAYCTPSTENTLLESDVDFFLSKKDIRTNLVRLLRELLC